MMRAVLFREHGAADVLVEERVVRPSPADEEVLIETRATSVNHLDIFVRRGAPGIRVTLPHIPGADAAGIVRETGRKVEGIETGARVLVNPGISCGRCGVCLGGAASQCRSFRILGEHRPGAYAEFITVPYYNVLRLPDAMSFEAAAAAPLVFVTAWSMLIAKGRIQPGENVLILGAGAGVGTAAVQIARLAGARVLVTAGSEEKLARLRSLGADVLIPHAETEFDQAVRRATDGRGADVVVDYIGRDTWARSLRAVRTGGRILTCGATSGFDAATDLRHVFYRQLQIIGSTMGSLRDFEQVMQCIFRGQLKPVVDRVLPLSEARRAHELLEARQVFGKVVLDVRR